MQPKEFLLYYTAIFFVAAYLIFRKRPRKGMLLRLRGGGRKANELSEVPPTAGRERALNVVFNHNGHSWDAYEVLGLPAGSAADQVERAYRESLERVDAGSKPFMEAAYRAIKSHSEN